MSNILTTVTLHLPNKTLNNIAKLTEIEHAKLPSLPPPSMELIVGLAVAEMLRRNGIEPELYPVASEAAKALRAIPSEHRSIASRENGRFGGRPKKEKPA
jgi:hypothetical protein